MRRSLCVYSFDHRGTPQQPGLVLGLDFGGACRGIAYRVTANKHAPTIAYLREREQTTAVYRASWYAASGLPAIRSAASTRCATGRPRPSSQYAAGLNHDKQLHIVRQAHGRSGPNRDYVLETAKALEALPTSSITNCRFWLSGCGARRTPTRQRLKSRQTQLTPKLNSHRAA